ncbi:MAG: hypothetical protein HYV63_08440 [Candidatus Schekmanbacteria bacterium]|nr:hypothetical protein [Candidatus Schekmanbacteria bacterium]
MEQESLARTIRKLHQDAARLFRLEMYAEAIERWEELLRLAPSAAKVERYLAVAYRKMELQREQAQRRGASLHADAENGPGGAEVSPAADVVVDYKRVREGAPRPARQAPAPTTPPADTSSAAPRPRVAPVDLSGVEIAFAASLDRNRRPRSLFERVPRWAVAGGAVLVPVVYLLLCYWNRNTFWLYYQPGQAEIAVWQGHWFPLGKEEVHRLRIGASSDWYEQLSEATLKQVITGEKALHGAHAMDKAVVQLLLHLAGQIRKTQSTDALQAAIYYLNRAREYVEVEQVPPQILALDTRLAAQVADAYFGLGQFHESRGEREKALAAYHRITGEQACYQDAQDRIRALESEPMIGEPKTAGPETTP